MNRRVIVLVSGTLATLLVLGAIGGGIFLLVRDDDTLAPPTTSGAVLAARTGAIAFFTLDSDHVEEDIQRVLDLGTGDFRSDYVAGLDTVRAAKGKDLHVTASVPEDGAALEQFAGTAASVLLAIDVRTASGSGSPTVEHYRARVAVTYGKDSWKVAALDQIPGRADAMRYRVRGLPAADAAPVRAAATAMVPALAYDYRDLAAGLRRATALMTPQFAAQFRRSFTKDVRPLVRRKKITARAYTRGAGLVRHQGDSARVLVFADQVVQAAKPMPTEARVLVDLVLSGGTWKVANITPV